MKRADIIDKIRLVIFDNLLKRIKADRHQELEIDIINSVVTKEDDIVDDFSSSDPTKVASANSSKVLNDTKAQIGRYSTTSAWLNHNDIKEGEYDISLESAGQNMFGYTHFKFKVQYLNLGTEYIQTIETIDGRKFRRYAVLNTYPDFEEIVVSGNIGLTAITAGTGISINNSTPLVPIISSHVQNTDTKLDEGGANEVTAAQVKTAYTHSQAVHAPSNAEQNINADWNATSGDAEILNKPTIPSITGLESQSNKGTANGYAPLDSTSKIASTYLPSYVDDVLEVANYAALPGTGDTGKIYVTLDTNYEYRWSGSVYIQLVSSPGTTDAVTEGTTNLYFTYARVRSSVLTGLSLATAQVITATDSVLLALGYLQAQITALTTPKETAPYVLSGLDADITVGVKVSHTILEAHTFTASDIYLESTAAPTDYAIVVDVKKNGTSIFSTKPQVSAGNLHNVTNPVLVTSPTTFSVGDIRTVIVDQIGSTETGKNLVLSILMHK